MAIAQAFGPDPWAFRLFQVALLWATAALLSLGERRRLGLWAWLAGLLFVLHPMNAALEIGGVRDQLVVFFFLAGLALRRWSAERGAAALLPAAAFALALLSKETAVVFPLLLLAGDWADERLESRDGRRRAAVVYAACLLVLAAYAAFRVLGLHRDSAFGMMPGYAPGESPSVILMRVLKLLSRIAGWKSRPVAAASLSALVLLLASRSRRLAAYYGAWLAAGLVFYSGLLPVQNLSALISLTSDEPYRLLLPAVGFLGLLALACRECRGRAAAGIVPAAAVAALTLASWHSFQWRAPERFEETWDWAETLPALTFDRRHAPERSLRYRAALRKHFGENAAALEQYYDGALEDPCRSVYLLRTVWARDDAALLARVEAGMSYRRGAAAAAANAWPEAEGLYRKTLALDGDHAAARRGLAAALWNLHRRPEAVQAALAADRIEEREFFLKNARCADPRPAGLAAEVARVRALAPLGPDSRREQERISSELRSASGYRRDGRFKESVDILRPLAESRPGDFDIRLELVDAALAAGMRGVAEESLARALPLAADRDQRRRLAERYQQAGAFSRAVELLRSLTRESPTDASLFQDLGISEHLAGDSAAAVRSLETAIRLDPRRLPAYVSLAYVDKALKRYGEARRIDDLALAVKTDDAALHEMIRKDRAALERRGR